MCFGGLGRVRVCVRQLHRIRLSAEWALAALGGVGGGRGEDLGACQRWLRCIQGKYGVVL